MSFQTIVDIQQSMNVNNRRVVGQQVSRAGYMTTAEYLTAVPWVFTIAPHQYLYYPQVRDVIQSIDNADRQNPQTITFASENLSWFTAYQGSLTDIQVNALTLASAPAANSQVISVGNLPSVAPSVVIFRAGDFIQLGDYPYKVKADVLRGSAFTVSVSLNRPVIGSPSVGTLTAVGSDVTFNVVAESCPTYTLNPMANGAFVEWDGPFVFREYIV